MTGAISNWSSPTEWSRDVARMHALMAALYASTGRYDLMVSEVGNLVERIAHFTRGWVVSA